MRRAHTGEGLAYVNGDAVGQDYAAGESGWPRSHRSSTWARRSRDPRRTGPPSCRSAGTTADVVFTAPELVERHSRVVTLYPGDVICTGTPAGVGVGRGLFRQPGDVVTSEIGGLGRFSNAFVAAAD